MQDLDYFRVGLETKIEHIDYWDFVNMSEAVDFYNTLKYDKGTSAKYIKAVGLANYDELECEILLAVDGYAYL